MNFIHFGFLAAGAAALSLPIWIHLLLRQRARAMEIGSIRFVRDVVRRTKSRQRIQRWLLLLLRCLAIGLLGLLFARPYLPDTPADGSTRQAAILIDRSASMLAQDENGTTAFDAAVQRARQYIDTLGDRARIQIGLFDASGVEVIDPEQLAGATCGWTATDYAESLAWAADALATDRRDRSLLLLSDLQRSAAPSSLSPNFPAGVLVNVEDPAPAVAQNLAIDSARPLQIELRPKVPIAISVGLFNSGAFPASDVPLLVELQGPQGPVRQQQTASLASGSRVTLRVELPIDEPGVYHGTVMLDREDPLPWDNRRFIGFEVRYPDRVLLVDGDPGRNAWENETYFLETALRLTDAVGDGPARTFEVERLVWDRGDGFPDLAGYRLVVLANLGRFTDGDASRLKGFVDGGGNVLMFLGARTTPTVFDPIRRSGLMPGIELAAAEETASRVRDIAAEHPALRPLADPRHGDLRTLAVTRLMPIRQLPAAAEVLLAGRKWPLIVTRNSGDGDFVLVTTTADRDWNDWPRNRLFVPLIRQLSAWLTGQLDASGPIRDETIRLATDAAGIEITDQSVRIRNVDPAESTIRRRSVEQFRELYRLPEAEIDVAEADRARYEPEGVSRPDEKWPWVVWSLLGILGIEILLASRVHE